MLSLFLFIEYQLALLIAVIFSAVSYSYFVALKISSLDEFWLGLSLTHVVNYLITCGGWLGDVLMSNKESLGFL